jgi:tol-pal system protein YbgF
MRRHYGVVLAVFIMAVTTQAARGQGFIYKLTHPDAVGGGFVATHTDEIGEMTDAGPGFELFLKYQLSPRVFFSAGTGFLTSTDDMLKMDMFRTTLFPSFEARAGIHLMDSRSFLPFVFIGAHAFGWKSESIINNQTQEVGTYYDGSLLAGAGVQVALNDKWSFHATGDYRYVISSDQDPKPEYWMAKAGLTYALGYEPPADREEMEYPVGQDELVLDDFFREDVSTAGEEQPADMRQPEEQDILDALFASEPESRGTLSPSEEAEGDVLSSLDTSTEALSETDMLRLTIENLRSDIADRTTRIEELENKVRDNERIIAEFTRRSASDMKDASFGVADTESFKNSYQQGLQRFYNKQYNEAIRTFSSLLANNPDHRLASNCQYWIGESHHAMGQFRQAIESFSAVLNYKRSYKFDDALIMSGLCHMKLGNTLTARENFQELLSRFPESEYTAKALRYLGRL